MPKRDPRLHSAVSRYAIHKRFHAEDSEQLAKLRSEYVTERLAVLVGRAFAESPLTAEQRERIAELVLAGGEP